MKHHHVRRLSEQEGPSTGGTRRSPTKRQRKEIIAKTGGKCHVCGGSAGKHWQADHLVPHRMGGMGAADNYLPICRRCNTLRRSYSPTVQQFIMQLGIYARAEIRDKSDLGEDLLRLFLRRHRQNQNRRRAQ
jgi:5-methylcytosine-specific restriction endonuclease McrA